MKHISYLILIIILSSCSQNENTKTVSAEESPTSNYSKIQHLFKDITPDSFYVYSDWSIEKSDFAFKGTAMDSNQICILPAKWIEHYSWNKDFAACFKFPLDSTRIALIARVSGEYVSSALKLFVFDLKKDSVVNTINLADVFGDAGEASIYSSCLFKDKNKNLFIITYVDDSYDHQAGDIETDTIVEQWNSYYTYRLSNNILDTISKDSAEVVSRYRTIVAKLSKF